MSDLTAKEELEQMIAGTHEDPEVSKEIEKEEEEEEESVEETEETESEEVETEETTETEEEESEESEEAEDNIEDTDQETETEEEEDTDQENDGSAEETSETEEKDLEEDAQDGKAESEEDSEGLENTDEVNYKEFYEKVALAKFTANGKEVEGFKDPEDLIRAQQMLHGYSDKMKVFKEYKKFLKPLEERGVTTDPDKFNLAMSLLDGDPEAIKKVLKEQKIDPLELDLEDIKYAPKNTLPSSAQLLIEESQEQAANLGVGEKFDKVIGKDWDVKSLQEFVNNGVVRNDLLQHLKDGTYDIVQSEIEKMELLDSTGVLNNMTSIDKYRMAVGRLNQQQQHAPIKTKKPAEEVVDTSAAEKKAEQEAEFKKKAAAEKEKRVAEQRKKAASMSKKKTVKKPKKKETKLEELKGDAFRDEFKKMLMG